MQLIRNEMEKRIVCIVGPTACHKTECAILLAKRIDGEIVSADSVQVYRGMDIGSAKPSLEERQGIPHHLIDCLPIDTPEFSVSQFRSMAAEAISEIHAKNRTPILVGGSGLYINALTFPLEFAVPRNDMVRQIVSQEYDENPEKAFGRLRQNDPETAARLHVNDKKRVVRALEVFDCSGKPLSAFGNDFQNDAGSEPPFLPLLFGLHMERQRLYERINLRVDRMMKQGLLEEAKRIYAMPYDRNLPAMCAIGYRQLFAYLDGESSLESAVEKIKQESRRYAKRQLTWFRRDQRILWRDVTNFEDEKERLLDEFTEKTQAFMKGTCE
ncbi:MAG: tRNA (adenosine(37)-N6)-dimethylallyltransferase MiaA [Eubacteriales bacterium]|nr:tRNA (adenosine(37)-N6)-dimethylallyltransferase MiaA [Eubacteriales bacterium]